MILVSNYRNNFDNDITTSCIHLIETKDILITARTREPLRENLQAKIQNQIRTPHSAFRIPQSARAQMKATACPVGNTVEDHVSRKYF